MKKVIEDKSVVFFLSPRWEKVIRPLQEAGYDFRYISVAGGWLYIFIGWFRLIRYLLEYKKAAIITDTADRLGLAAVIAAKLMRRKLIYRARGDAIRESYISKRRFGIYTNTRLFFPSLSGIIPCSNYLGDVALKKYPSIGKSNVIAVPLPIPLKKKSDNVASVDEREKSIIIVSKFHFIDKVRPLRDIAPQLMAFLSTHTDFKCQVLGDGAYLSEIKQIYEHSCSSTNIDFKGFVDNPEKYYATGYCLLHVSELDGYPSVIDEARINKMPVICSSTLGLPEMVSDYEDGFLLKKDFSNFEEIMCFLLAKENYEKVASNGFNRVESINSMVNVGNSFASAIATILNQ